MLRLPKERKLAYGILGLLAGLGIGLYNVVRNPQELDGEKTGLFAQCVMAAVVVVLCAVVGGILGVMIDMLHRETKTHRKIVPREVEK